MKHLRKGISAILIMAVFFSLFLLSAMPVHASGGLTISTPYPGTTVTAGKTTTFTLTLDNSSTIPMNAAITANNVPDGWTASFTGAGNPVSRVYVRAGASATVTLSLDVPSGTAEGDYSLSVTANAAGIAEDTLYMGLHVSATDVTQSGFTSQFPELQGGATTSFSFSADLTNNGSDDQYYSLTAAAPDGWQISFRPASASSDIASLTIASGQSQTLTITAKPPADVTAGVYDIPCSAVSTTETKDLDLKVTITGTYTLTVTTQDGRLNADAQVGKETPVTLVLTNTGSADLTGLALSSTLPTTSWAVRFDQSTIDTLAAGATQNVIAYIQPDSQAVTGDYAATITVKNPQVTTSIDLRVAVKTSTLWGVIAVIIIVILAGGLYLIFRKFGRR